MAKAMTSVFSASSDDCRAPRVIDKRRDSDSEHRVTSATTAENVVALLTRRESAVAAATRDHCCTAVAKSADDFATAAKGTAISPTPSSAEYAKASVNAVPVSESEDMAVLIFRNPTGFVIASDEIAPAAIAVDIVVQLLQESATHVVRDVKWSGRSLCMK
jgi:hypothetical protein